MSDDAKTDFAHNVLRSQVHQWVDDKDDLLAVRCRSAFHLMPVAAPPLLTCKHAADPAVTRMCMHEVKLFED